ncbi:Collagen alpha-1(XII) chain [Gracilaria domingensis]|nr:Collagen alpha-1(XII) chain [Gracilaria domingensis]
MVLSTFLALLNLIGLFVSVQAIPFTIRQQNESAAEPDCAINSICFALDQSNSISDAEYLIQQQFVIDVSRELNTRTAGTLYSAYGFAFSANLIQSSTTQLEDEFIPAVNETARSFGGTDVYDGLRSCFEEVQSSSGNRVIVIVTDGVDNGTPLALDQAPLVKAEGIAIVTVGVGDGVDADYLRALATTPDFFIDSSFETLPSDVVRVAESSCDVVEVTPEPILMTPSPDPFDACEEASLACPFRFDGLGDAPTFSVDGPADEAFTPIIVSGSASERLGRVADHVAGGDAGVFADAVQAVPSARHGGVRRRARDVPGGPA